MAHYEANVFCAGIWMERIQSEGCAEKSWFSYGTTRALALQPSSSGGIVFRPVIPVIGPFSIDIPWHSSPRKRSIVVFGRGIKSYILESLYICHHHLSSTINWWYIVQSYTCITFWAFLYDIFCVYICHTRSTSRILVLSAAEELNLDAGDRSSFSAMKMRSCKWSRSNASNGCKGD